uniref:AGC-kinase C-terminal domain-containing protein n=1 Tax=Macrostomum lignano TaxID=282301 RepID=A0A1I8FND6_9PLAT
MCVMNPFGDDDEDFQTSEILDYNLEISRRSASADEMMFPFDFKLPDMKTKPQPQAEADNLPEFLARMSIEMERTHRELLVEMSEPVGLTRVGISAIVATWSPWTAVSRSLRSPMASQSIQTDAEAAAASIQELLWRRRWRRRRDRNDGDDGDGCGAAAFVAKNCHASVAAASSSGVSWDRRARLSSSSIAAASPGTPGADMGSGGAGGPPADTMRTLPADEEESQRGQAVLMAGAGRTCADSPSASCLMQTAADSRQAVSSLPPDAHSAGLRRASGFHPALNSFCSPFNVHLRLSGRTHGQGERVPDDWLHTTPSAIFRAPELRTAIGL